MSTIKIVRSQRRKTVSIQVEPDTSITVKAPLNISETKINNILHQHKDWIKAKQLLLKERLAQQKSKGEKIYLYLGKSYPLAIRHGQKSIIEVEDKMYLGSTNTKYIHTYLTSWYKQQARKIIVQRVYHYAKILNLTCNGVNITSAGTRWGSCSSEKSLNFNWRLIMAPLPVIDYVVTHELAHLVEMNHSRSFWETVRKMYPLYREYRLWLKKYGHTLRI